MNQPSTSNFGDLEPVRVPRQRNRYRYRVYNTVKEGPSFGWLALWAAMVIVPLAIIFLGLFTLL